jgi:3-hydroxyisobutyrate dehydrogenase
MQNIESGSKIAFIGLGVMGQSMALNLIAAGFELNVYTRTKSKATAVIAAGAHWCDSISTSVSDVSAVISIIGYPKDVREVYLGEKGIIDSVKTGTVLIDMTTSEPTLAKDIYQAAIVRSAYSLDAPVSGGDIGAKSAALSIMVGGDEEVYEASQSIFLTLGKTIVYQGPAGSGQHTKMANQIAIATNMIGVMEALLYARKAGLNPMTVLDSIGSGAAGSWSLSNMYPRVVNEDYDPGFYIIHFIKDMRIAVEEAASMGLSLLGLQMALAFYERLDEQGDGLLGTQALYKILDEVSSQ